MTNENVVKTSIPNWLKPYLLHLLQLEYKGIYYDYTVVSSGLSALFGENAPQMFTIKTQGVLAVSETCPEKYRELFLIHEIIENPESEELADDACLNALQEEISLAKDRVSDFRDYTSVRFKFFEGLVAYYEKEIKDEKEEKLLVRLLRSRDYLKSTFPSVLYTRVNIFSDQTERNERNNSPDGFWDDLFPSKWDVIDAVKNSKEYVTVFTVKDEEGVFFYELYYQKTGKFTYLRLRNQDLSLGEFKMDEVNVRAKAHNILLEDGVELLHF